MDSKIVFNGISKIKVVLYNTTLRENHRIRVFTVLNILSPRSNWRHFKEFPIALETNLSWTLVRVATRYAGYTTLRVVTLRYPCTTVRPKDKKLTFWDLDSRKFLKYFEFLQHFRSQVAFFKHFLRNFRKLPLMLKKLQNPKYWF